MALTRDEPVPHNEGDFNDLPVAATTLVFEGSVVSVSAAGFASNYSGTDTIFGGISVKRADNSAGANGDKRVRVRRGIFYVTVTLSGAAQANVGDSLFASDDNTFTLASTGNLLVGTISDLVGTDKVRVKMETNV